jgi:hypothetical protein
MGRHDIPYDPRRYPKVPWSCITEADLHAVGDPEVSVDFSHMRILSMRVTWDGVIPLPDGCSDAMISIRALDDGEPGGVITLAITNNLPIDYAPVPSQSNPKRHFDKDESDGA